MRNNDVKEHFKTNFYIFLYSQKNALACNLQSTYIVSLFVFNYLNFLKVLWNYMCYTLIRVLHYS